MTDSSRPRGALRRLAGGSGWLRSVAIGLAVLVVLAGGTYVWLYAYADARLGTEDIPGVGDDLVGSASADPNAPTPVTEVTNVLVVGSDSREGLTDAQLEELGTNREEREGLADTIMLVHLSPQREDAVVLSFPRDLKVAVPGHGSNKINSALILGGPRLLIQTVEEYTGIPIDHYVEIDLAGFLELVDVIGGVEVCLEEPLVDADAGADLPAGRQVVTGKDAAGYVRARKTDPRGDLGRIDRQQRFIRSALDEVLSPGTLANPLRMKQLIDRGASAVTTDAGFGTTDMFRLAWSLRSLDPGEVTMLTVPADAGPSFVNARPEEAEAVFQAIRTDTELPGAEPEVLVPADVRVEILNATDTGGLAARARTYLTDRGLDVAGVGNAEATGTTVIQHAPDARMAAALLAAYFPDAEVVEAGDLGDDLDVRVVLGRDWADDPEEVPSVDPSTVTVPEPSPDATPTPTGVCA